MNNNPHSQAHLQFAQATQSQKLQKSLSVANAFLPTQKQNQERVNLKIVLLDIKTQQVTRARLKKNKNIDNKIKKV